MQTTKPVTKPTKQRKRLFQAPAHVRHKLLAAHLSPELRGSHIVKSFPVRSGDTVRIMRGDHKGFEGKISRVDLKNYRIYVEGLTREKVDGTTIFVPVHPSKVVVTHLNLDDKWRKEILEAKKGAFKKPREAPAKPKVKPEEKPPEVAEVKEAVEEKRVEEKPAVEEKPKKKRVARAKPKTAKKKVTEKPEMKPKKAAKEEEKPKAAKEEEKPKAAKEEEKPKAEKKRTRRKTAEKTEEGGE
jgi:large subunit ribosomal protein L24